MKKIFSFLVLLANLLLAWPAGAGFVYHIELLNGTALPTPRYWMAGEEVRFVVRNGEGRVERSRVRRIYRQEQPDADEIFSWPLARPAVAGGGGAAETLNAVHRNPTHDPRQRGVSSGPGAEVPAADRPYWRARQALIALQRLRYDDMREARKFGGDGRQEELVAVLKAVELELAALEADVRRSNQGRLPAWWDQ